MKTYQSPTKDKKTKKNFFMRNIYGFILGISLLVVAGIVTLTLVLTLRKSPIVDVDVPNDVGVVAPPAQTYVVPLDDYTVGKSASVSALVYSSTLTQWRTHDGVDLLTTSGSNVKCVTDGRVSAIKETTLEGTVVTVEHEDGLVSIYKGLGSVSVKEGDTLSAGAVIGTVAENMMIEQREGAHLHLEMKKSGKYIDPATYLQELSENK